MRYCKLLLLTVSGLVLISNNQDAFASHKSPFETPTRIYVVRKKLSTDDKVIILGRNIVPGSERLHSASSRLKLYQDYWMDYKFGLLRLSDKWVGSGRTVNFYAVARFNAHARKRLFHIDFESVYKLAYSSIQKIKSKPSPGITSLIIISKTAIRLYSSTSPDDPRLPKLRKLEKSLDGYIEKYKIPISFQ